MYGEGLVKLEAVSNECIGEFLDYVEKREGRTMDYYRIFTTTIINIISSMVSSILAGLGWIS